MTPRPVLARVTFAFSISINSYLFQLGFFEWKDHIGLLKQKEFISSYRRMSGFRWGLVQDSNSTAGMWSLYFWFCFLGKGSVLNHDLPSCSPKWLPSLLGRHLPKFTSSSREEATSMLALEKFLTWVLSALFGLPVQLWTSHCGWRLKVGEMHCLV